MSACPADAVLTAYQRDSLPSAQGRELEQHLTTCRRCAQRLAQLPGWEPLVRDVRLLDEAAARDADVVRRVTDSATSLHESSRGSSAPPQNKD